MCNTCRIDSDYVEVDDGKPVDDGVVLQENAAYCSQVQLQQNVSYITSTEINEYVLLQSMYIGLYWLVQGLSINFKCTESVIVTCRTEVYDYIEVKGKQADVLLQQNVSYVTSSRNHQQQQYVLC